MKKAFDDEMLFVLMGRDATAPKVVLEWIKENLFTQPEDKLREAFECALKMKNTQADLYQRKYHKPPTSGGWNGNLG